MLLRKDEDLSTFFKYEIAPFPLSLFTSSGMRKNVKFALYEEFECVDDSRMDSVRNYVIDGGHLLHAVKWDMKKKNQTYVTICFLHLFVIYSKICPVRHLQGAGSFYKIMLKVQQMR